MGRWISDEYSLKSVGFRRLRGDASSVYEVVALNCHGVYVIIRGGQLAYVQNVSFLICYQRPRADKPEVNKLCLLHLKHVVLSHLPTTGT